MKSSGFVSAALVSAIAILIPFSASHSFERSAWFDPYSILIYNADVANAHWLGECDSGLANLNVWKRNLSGAARQLGFQWMGDLGLTNLLVSFDAEGWDSLGYGCPYDVMQDFKPRGMFRYLDAQRIQYFIAETQLNSEHGPCCWNQGGYRTGVAGEITRVHDYETGTDIDVLRSKPFPQEPRWMYKPGWDGGWGMWDRHLWDEPVDLHVRIRARCTADPNAPSDHIATFYWMANSEWGSFGFGEPDVAPQANQVFYFPSMQNESDGVSNRSWEVPRFEWNLRTTMFDSSGYFEILDTIFVGNYCSVDMPMGIYYQDNHTLEVHWIEIWDEGYHRLFRGDSTLAYRESVQDAFEADYSAERIAKGLRGYYTDEPGYYRLEAFGLCNGLAQAAGAANPYINGTEISANMKMMEQLEPYNILPQAMMMEFYPFGGDTNAFWWDVPKWYFNPCRQFCRYDSDEPYSDPVNRNHSLQFGLDWAFYGKPNEYRQQRGYPESDTSFSYYPRHIHNDIGTKAWACLQAGAEYIPNPTNSDLPDVRGGRTPTLNEMSCEAWMALSAGIDGIVWYWGTSNPNITDDQSLEPNGLLAWNLDGTGSDLCTGSWEPVQTERFEAARAVSAMLDTIGPILDGLQWEGTGATRAFETYNAFPVHFNGSEPYVLHYRCEKDTGGPHWIGENPCSTYVQYTGFTNPSAGVNEDYWVMVVNRRCLANEARKVTFELTELPYAQGKTYVLHHILSGTTYSRTMIHGESQPDYVRTCAIELAPGHGELVHIWGGLILIKVTIYTQGIYAVLTWSPPQGMDNPSYLVDASTDGGKTYETIGQTTQTTYSDLIASRPTCLYRILAYKP